ncbi:unnamed protein product [Paramecium pentaurelia]|uniref:Uncharacterized protein n=1 Tax=Paramecium pentaurelia TaxID=43138 RepID=A0A8S1WMA9_9CILI|nr:unnamed protein product [Paramecium pentaurelia]
MPEANQWQLVQKVLIFGILSSLISSFGRADYNLPLFIFAIFLWEFEKFHTRIIYLLLFSFIIDFVYALYWHNQWSRFKILETKIDSLLHSIVILTAMLNMIIKIVVILYSVGNNNEVKHNLFPGAIKDNLINFITFKNTGDD